MSYLSEGSGVDGDDGSLDECFGSDQFVVGGVVDDVDDADFARDGLGCPGEIA